MRYLHLFFASILLISCSQPDQDSESLSPDITVKDLQQHINYLASDSLQGRQAGTPGEDMAREYIVDHFRGFGLRPAGDDSTFLQHFTVNLSVMNNPHTSDRSSYADKEQPAENIIGLIEGTQQTDSYVVIGAHYDHLGTGDFGSFYSGSDTLIHNGADDNASGTAGLMELAQYFTHHPPQKSIVFIAFSGEEIGLLGSRFFVENPTIPLKRIEAMINMDMVGRLRDNELTIMGLGSSDAWSGLIEKANTDSLIIKTVPDGVGASDHTSFYNKNIPVLHYFTGTHADYHRPSDDPQYINYKGEVRVLNHLQRVVATLDSLPAISFTEAPVTQKRDVALEGPTLGVSPDYGFDGHGMRITSVNKDGPAAKAGLQGKDVIIGLNGKDITDIYKYMEVLNSLSEGQKTTVTVLRENAERTFDITL